MKSTRHMTFIIAAAAITAPVAALQPAPADKKKQGRDPAKPCTPQEIRAQKAFEGANGKLKQAGHHYPTSPKAVQHAGAHKNKGTPKGIPFKK